MLKKLLSKVQDDESMHAKLQQEYKCCERCLLMTSTMKGLRALTSGQGYEHYRVFELEAAAKSGCLLCAFVWEGLNKSHNMRAHTQETLRFFTNGDGPVAYRERRKLGKRPYPFTDLPFDELTAYTPRVIVNLVTFAAEGRLPVTWLIIRFLAKVLMSLVLHR